MKFMVEARLKTGSTRSAIEAFEQRGPNRTLGVSYRGAWIDTRRELVYVLLESEDEQLVHEACRAWADIGDSEIHAVVEIEQF